MEAEHYFITDEVADLIQSAKSARRRVIAVGTSAVRTLESFSRTGKKEDSTALFIHPPFEFKIVNSLITNFHLPRSSLLLLVCAFAGRELILQAYNKALEENFGFYSYGDACFIV